MHRGECPKRTPQGFWVVRAGSRPRTSALKIRGGSRAPSPRAPAATRKRSRRASFFDSLWPRQPHDQGPFYALSATAAAGKSPDLELQLQFITELLPDALPNLIDEFEDIGGLRTRVGDDEVGVSVGDFRPAVPGPLRPAWSINAPAGRSGLMSLKI